MKTTSILSINLLFPSVPIPGRIENYPHLRLLIQTSPFKSKLIYNTCRLVIGILECVWQITAFVTSAHYKHLVLAEADSQAQVLLTTLHWSLQLSHTAATPLGR